MDLHLFIFTNRLHGIRAIISTPPSSPLPSSHHYHPAMHIDPEVRVKQEHLLSSHTKPSTLVVLKRDWWGFADFNGSSLCESTGRRGRRGDGAARSCKAVKQIQCHLHYPASQIEPRQSWQTGDWLVPSLARLLRLQHCCCSVVHWSVCVGSLHIIKRSWQKQNKLLME